MDKYCVLNETKLCDDCGECQKCDLDPNKICDNCMKCVQTGADYTAIEIDEIHAPSDAANINPDDILD